MSGELTVPELAELIVEGGVFTDEDARALAAAFLLLYKASRELLEEDAA